jgi:hypothetical protein
MSQTKRFLEALYQEQDDLEESEQRILALLMKMHPEEFDVENATRIFHKLCNTADELCRTVWLDFEPKTKNEDSEALLLISEHVSSILLCKWQKWTFKPPATGDTAHSDS